jgi:MoaA/NifB/PqqE/SkfB family radical SAM enzyme
MTDVEQHIIVDIEPTNRCNADCYFCPRDQTPHEGRMTPELFDVALGRVIELDSALRRELGFGVRVSLCGLGEPLLNKHTPRFVAQVTEAGLPCVMSSNAGLLDERRAHELLDAGLRRININIGDIGASYESVYKLDFERTRDHIVRFAELAEGRCEVAIVLVDYKVDADHVAAMQTYWRDLGITRFISYGIINRGGALEIDHADFERSAEIVTAREMFAALEGPAPVCAAPFLYMFVGYDGQYYLCCSDWRKQVPLGSVHDETFLSVVADKLRHVTERTEVCRRCNLDPLNRLTEQLRAVQAGGSTDAETAALMAELDGARRPVADLVERMRTLAEQAPPPGGRRRIPVRSI